MSSSIALTFRYLPKEAGRAINASAFEHLRLRHTITPAVLLVSAFWVVGFGGNKYFWLGILFGAIGVAPLLWLAISLFVLPRWVASRNADADVEYQFIFSADAVLVRTASFDSRVLWKHFKGFSASRDFYLIHETETARYLIIPKRAFRNEADVAAFEALLAAQLPNADGGSASDWRKRKRVILYIALACLAVSAIFAGVRATLWGRLQREILNSMTHDLSRSEGRLAEMRKHLRPYWSPGEAGGIFLFTGMDEKVNEAFFTALAAKVSDLASVGREQQMSKLADTLADDVGAFFTSAKLAPGTYQLDNYHLEQARDGKLAFNADGDPPIELPRERTFGFTVKDEHLKLLRHVHTREWHGYLVLMDMKRPYGDMTYYFIDMADALGEPSPPRDANKAPQFTQQQIDRYLQLHREMLFAAQAFWTYAQ
jgi:hypothetical protein